MTVTEADRRAAAEAYSELTGMKTTVDDVRGDWLTRRFARHREQARREAIEAVWPPVRNAGHGYVEIKYTHGEHTGTLWLRTEDTLNLNDEEDNNLFVLDIVRVSTAPENEE